MRRSLDEGTGSGLQEGLRLFVEQVPALAWATDRDLQILWMVGAGFRTLNPASVQGRNLREILRESTHYQEAIDAHLGALEGRASRYENALQGVVAEVRVEPFRDSSGQIIGSLGLALDVTEQRGTKDALQKNRLLLLQAEALGRLGNWDHDLLTGEVFTSEENRRLFFGDAPDKGSSFDDYGAAIHPDDRDRVLEAHKQLIEQGRGPSDIEFRVVWPDGTVRWIHGRKQVVRANGAPVRQFGINVDITERKQREDELRKRERQLVEAQKVAHVGSWERIGRSEMIELSEEARRIVFGDGSGPVLSFQEFLASVHPDDRALVRSFREAYMADDAPLPMDLAYRIVRPDGAMRWIQSRIECVRDANGEQVRVTGTLLDITDRKRAEDELDLRLRQQAAVAELGMRALRGDSLPALLDEAVATLARTCQADFAEVMELQPDKMLVMRSAAGWPPGAVGSVLPFDATQCGFTLKSQAPVVIEDLREEKRFSVDPFLLDHGLVSGITVLIPTASGAWGTLGVHTTYRRTWSQHDINFLQSIANALACAIDHERTKTELREKHDRLQSLSHRLLEAQEAERRAVARELHDDFGQVLTAIKINLERRVNQQAETVSLVDQALERIHDLAQDLRPPMLDELGLSAALRWYVAREAQRAGMEFDLRIDSLETRPPPAVEASCFRIVQEALTNVVRHAGAHLVVVELHAEEGVLRLVVRDNGRGFDVADVRRRATEGLVGMQERAALAGGALEIESTPGRGTVIIARFPLTEGGTS
jgi:PAS domain S-box-containing protein